MGVIEITVIAILALWTLASVGYCSRNPRWHLLTRWNRQFCACSSWRLFGADDRAAPSGVVELDYRDHRASDESAPWMTVKDSCWSWHAFLWMPDRRLANRVYYLIRELAACVKRPPTADHPLPLPARMIANYSCRRTPLRAGERREFRLVVRHRPETSDPETLYTFSIGPRG